MLLPELSHAIREGAARDLTLTGEKAFIVLCALFIVYLALTINNKWILAGIIAYEVLP